MWDHKGFPRERTDIWERERKNKTKPANQQETFYVTKLIINLNYELGY